MNHSFIHSFIHPASLPDFVLRTL